MKLKIKILSTIIMIKKLMKIYVKMMWLKIMIIKNQEGNDKANKDAILDNKTVITQNEDKTEKKKIKLRVIKN